MFKPAWLYVLAIAISVINLKNTFAAPPAKPGTNTKQPATQPAKPVPPKYTDLPGNFVSIYKGPKAVTFMMGSSAEQENHEQDETLHAQTISEAFEMQDVEVTQAQFVKMMERNPSYFAKPEFCPKDYKEIQFKKDPKCKAKNCAMTIIPTCLNHPVERVTWKDVQDYIKRLNNSKFAAEHTYRLPKEIEWEYAVRFAQVKPATSTSTEAYAFGSDIDLANNFAHTLENSKEQTQPVATKADNNKLFDMHGNVWEWMADCYADYPSENKPNYQAPEVEGCSRVIRGGGWHTYVEYARSANRFDVFFEDLGRGRNDVGFRLVRVVKAVKPVTPAKPVKPVKPVKVVQKKAPLDFDYKAWTKPIK